MSKLRYGRKQLLYSSKQRTGIGVEGVDGPEAFMAHIYLLVVLLFPPQG